MFPNRLIAVSARNLLLPDADPASRTFFTFSFQNAETGLHEYVYRSEGVTGSANPEWMPPSVPLWLPLTNPHTVATLSIYQVCGKLDHCDALNRPACWSVDQRRSSFQLEPVPSTDQSCLASDSGNEERDSLHQQKPLVNNEDQIDQLPESVRISSAHGAKVGSSSTSMQSDGGTPAIKVYPKAVKLSGSQAPVIFLDAAKQGMHTGLQSNEAVNSRFLSTVDAAADAVGCAAVPGIPNLAGMQGDIDTGKLVLTQVLSSDKLHLIGEELRNLRDPLAPNTVVLEMEDGLYVHPAPLQACTHTISADSSPSKRALLQSGDQLPQPASPSSSAPRRFATMLMSKLMRSTPNLQGAGGSSLRSEQESDEESEASIAARFSSQIAAREAVAAAGYTKQISLSDMHLHIAALVSLRSSIVDLQKQSLQLKQRINELVEVRQLAREQKSQVHDAQRRARDSRQHVQHLQQHLSKVQALLASTRKTTTVRAQALITTLKVMQAADRKLQDGQESLFGDQGRERLVGLHRELVGRRCLMVSQLGKLYQLGPITVKVLDGPPGGYLEERLERQWVGEQSLAAAPNLTGSTPMSLNGSALVETPRQRQEAHMSIGGIELRSAVWRSAFDGSVGEVTAEEDQAAAVALGYVAHVVDRLSKYLDVPLRYPIALLGSRSSIFDGLASANTWSSEEPTKRSIFGRSEPGGSPSWAAAGMSSKPVEYPLYCNSRRERQQFAVGVFLLNKNVTQLLQAHGMTAGGPNQLLHNLYKLLMAAHSALPHLQQAAMH